ncbi:hypothetical protein LTR37_008414 [Vermiconidia calcicola]|uniref:Uncharacterized protein n=1 Tax=Vermiconidia calcicola TaxID=1690605 RepID=A0ACC3NAG5_9PEZI|nr:hypothetical protein LTR37_008414 [Vermiconidia calcicola]
MDDMRRNQLEGFVKQPPFTRTCREILEEALPLFYQDTIFVVSCHWQQQTERVEWLQAIGQKNRSLLKHLHFTDTPDLKAFAKIEEDLTVEKTKASEYVLKSLHGLSLQEVENRHGRIFQVSFT